jgi:hypothetical protein
MPNSGACCFRFDFRLAIACTHRCSFRAIDGLSRPDANNAKSCASSAGVHGRLAGRAGNHLDLDVEQRLSLSLRLHLYDVIHIGVDCG